MPKPKPELKLQSLMSLTSDIVEQGPRKSQIEKLISSGASYVWLQLDLQGAPCSCLVKAVSTLESIDVEKEITSLEGEVREKLFLAFSFHQ